MANITMIEDAKMAARGKVTKWAEEYRAQYAKPKRAQALGAQWLGLTDAQKTKLAEVHPEVYHEIMTLLQKGKGK